MNSKIFDTLEQSIELYKRGLQPNTESVYIWNCKETKLKHFDIKGDTVSQLKSLYDDNTLIKVAEENHFLHNDFTQTICPAYAKGTFDEDGPYARVYSIGWYKMENFEIEGTDFNNYRYMIYNHVDTNGVIVAKGINNKFGFLAIREVESGSLTYHFDTINPECIYELKDVLRILRRASKTSREYYKYRYEAECIDNAISKLKELEGVK
nr:MAG TPA: hypothetical protein [Caudoviricetes sp.]